MAQFDDGQDPYEQGYPATATAPRLTGPITDPHDPRLADPSYASDPNVLSFLNSIYGAQGTAQTPTPGTPGWDPNQQAWNAPMVGGDNPGTPPPAATPAPAPGPAAAPAPAPGPQSAPPPSSVSNYTPPPAFSYQDFVAPTGQDVLNDPSYGFEFNQGLQAIGAKNAALGTLNTGGTIKDFMGFGQNLANTKLNDIYSRNLSTYNTNRGNAVDAYNLNYGTQYRDPYAFSLQGAGLTQNNQQFNAGLAQNANQFGQNLDWQKFLQSYRATVTDPFQQKYSLLGLL